MTVTGYAKDTALVDSDWALQHLNDPKVPLRRGGRRHDRRRPMKISSDARAHIVAADIAASGTNTRMSSNLPRR
jgi:hypothetical protein